jgi:predicted RNase H-like HicB family nuclease
LPDYIALIHKDADSDYSVSFPDFPGCITAGGTIDEARALAADALAFHVEGMREDGQELPAPSPMAAVMTERENRDAVAFLVTLPDQAERHVRIQITMAEGLVRAIDARTNNRSRFLAAAAEQILQKRVAARSQDQGGDIRHKRGKMLRRRGSPTLKKKR